MYFLESVYMCAIDVSKMKYANSSFMTYHRVCKWSNITGATSGAGTAFPSGVPEFAHGFSWVHVAQSTNTIQYLVLS
jgi:hypothetical protein